MNQWFKDFIAGSVSGILGTLVGHPLDTVKCRIQAKSTNHSSSFSVIKVILREEKFLGLFKGVIPPILNQFPINAMYRFILFSLFSEYYRMYRYLDYKQQGGKKYSKDSMYLLSGCYSGIIYIIINTPCELIKCRQQLNADKFTSLSENAREIYLKDGLKGFYRGLCVSANRDIVSFGLYFYVYYKLKDHWESNKSLNSIKLMFAGGLAGLSAWFSTYPFDTLKTIIQGNSDKRTLTQLEAYIILRKRTNSNFTCLYNGLSACLIRSFYTNAVIFYTNELCQNYLNKF